MTRIKDKDKDKREGWRDRRGPEKVAVFGTYNIRSGRNGGLESALRGLVQGQVDCVLIQYTKLIYRFYTRELSGFRVTATAAPRAHRCGVAVFYRKA